MALKTGNTTTFVALICATCRREWMLIVAGSDNITASDNNTLELFDRPT